jgi:hypothetical protein
MLVYIMCGELSWDLYFDTLEILENHCIKHTRNRPNVSGLSHLAQWGRNKGTDKYDKVGFPARSQNFGMVTKRYCNNGNPKVKFDTPFQPASNNLKFPELYQQLKTLINVICPNFEYNTITVNHNFKCLPHYDRANKSPSLIVTLGNYSGGELVVEGCEIDIHWRPLIMNGSTAQHWTKDFNGERYSIIYYKI